MRNEIFVNPSKLKVYDDVSLLVYVKIFFLVILYIMTHMIFFLIEQNEKIDCL